MTIRIRAIVIATLLVAMLAFACSDREDPDKIWKGGSRGNGVADEGAVKVTGATGDYGDIEVFFTLAPQDAEKRDVTLFYQGGCYAQSSWVEAVFSGESKELAPGDYSLIWHSWDQEAGCAGEAEFRVSTGNEGESGQGGPFAFDNTGEGRSGFFATPLLDQGINDTEAPYFDEALDALLADPTVDFVATRYGDVYEVHSARGAIEFQRMPTIDGYEYDVTVIDGVNPIERQDPTWLNGFDEEIAGGSNPNNISYPDLDYDSGDSRLSFVEPEDDSYPFGYERIAAYFDHYDSADFMVNWVGYAHATVDTGEHGSLNIIQSRSPLIFWGKGIEPGGGNGEYSRQVDIAPTVGKLLGFEKTEGVDERGIWSHTNYLGWQDGHVIDSVLDGETPSTVIVIVSDGLNHNEVIRQLDSHADQLPNLSRLVDEGAMMEYGSTTNWPSVTYPSHNVIGSGVYSGHHGLVDNEYYIREWEWEAHPISQLVFTASFWNPIGPAETLHEAVHRNFGIFHRGSGEGALTASLLDPSVYGADKADIEFRDRTGEVPFPPFNVDWPVPGPSPDFYFLTHSISVWGEEFLVSIAMVELYNLFENTEFVDPTYVIFNNMPTDGAGHVYGPHGDKMDRVISKLDENLGLLFGWLERWGLQNKVAIVLTSDHGMQLGDISRSGWPMDSLDAAGIKRKAETWLGGYLALMLTEYSQETVTLGEEQTIRIKVRDEDDFGPIPGVEVSATDGVSNLFAITNAFGEAEFVIVPQGDVEVTVSHPNFTSVIDTLQATGR